MLIQLTIADIFDLLLRGGTVGMLFLLAVHLMRTPFSCAMTAIGIVFCLTGVAESILNSQVLMELAAPPVELTLPLQQLHFISIWWFVLAMFDDQFSWRPHFFWPIAIAAPLTIGAVVLTGEGAMAMRIGLITLNAGLLVLVFLAAGVERSADLVDERRSFRRALAFTVPPFTLFVSTMNLVHMWQPLSPAFSTINAAIYYLMALGFSFWMTNLKQDFFARSNTGREMPAAKVEMNSADCLELDRVIKAMDGGLYLEPGLTIGMLGDRLRIPEHRLRRLINQGLGYRNFAAFVNDYRIDEAKRRLSDPELAREQIIQHAFSLGYASLAPFNRAFRERVGTSPTEFRQDALARVAAE